MLARARLTSDVEIYDSAGTLLSRFALNFPEYTSAAQQGARGLPVGGLRRSTAGWRGAGAQHAARPAQHLRSAAGPLAHHHRARRLRLPHAAVHQRAVDATSTCSARRPTAAAPKVARRRRRLHPLRLGPHRDLHLRRHDAWPLDDATFDRVYQSRSRSGPGSRSSATRYNVYFANDRLFIYAIGYPIPGVFDHLVRLAELTTLAAAGYVLILLVNALFSLACARRARRPAGRSCARSAPASIASCFWRSSLAVDRPGPHAGVRHPGVFRGFAARRHHRPKPPARPPSRSASSKNPTRSCAAATNRLPWPATT